jgi:hypothetical protein
MDTVLEVQKGTIDANDIFRRIDKSIASGEIKTKEEKDNG